MNELWPQGVRELLEDWQVAVFDRWQEAFEAHGNMRVMFSVPRRGGHNTLAEAFVDEWTNPGARVVRETVEAAYADGETPIYGLDADELLERHAAVLRERLATNPVQAPHDPSRARGRPYAVRPMVDRRLR